MWRVGLIFCLGCGGTEATHSAPLVDPDCIAAAHKRIDEGEPVLPPAPATSDGRPVPVSLPATTLEAHRISGRRAIPPDDRTKREIQKQHVTQTSPSFKLCLDVQGVPTTITRLRPSCFPRYDEEIVETMRTWRYSPYLKDGAPVAVCTAVTFIYTQR